MTPMALLDYQGRPVSPANLRQEEAFAHTQTVRSPWDDTVATGMTPEEVVAFLRAASLGEHETYVQFAADMERRDPHYYSVLQQRKLAVAQLQRKVVSPTDDSHDVEMAETLDSIINGEGFTSTMLNILDALGKGFSITEIIWDTTGKAGRQWMPSAFKWRNPKFFKPHPDTGDVWLLRDKGHPQGKPLSPFKYLIHEPQLVSGLSVGGGLARQCVAMHMFKSFGIRSWMAFAEVFGMPLRIGKYAPGTTPEDMETLRKALRDLGSDAAAILPEGLNIALERAAMSGSAGSDEFFESLARFMNAEMSKAVLGQTMTVEDGSSLAQATIHNEVRLDIRDADAEMLQDTINRDFIRPWVDLHTGPRPRPQDYPRLVLDVEEPEDLVSLATALTPFIDRGLEVEQSVIRDKFQLPEPEAGAKILVAPAKPAPGQGDEDQDEDDEDKDENNLRNAALVATICRTAEKHTNMREFKDALTEIINNATSK